MSPFKDQIFFFFFFNALCYNLKISYCTKGRTHFQPFQMNYNIPFLFIALKLAPLLTSKSTHSLCPLLAAMCNAVSPCESLQLMSGGFFLLSCFQNKG